jgi:hypothetical protein
MADSVVIDVPVGTWTEIAEGPLTDCLVTTNRDCFYLYTAAAPSSSLVFGHSIEAFENVNAVPDTDQSFWILSPTGPAEVVVTEREPAP